MRLPLASWRAPGFRRVASTPFAISGIVNTFLPRADTALGRSRGQHEVRRQCARLRACRVGLGARCRDGTGGAWLLCWSFGFAAVPCAAHLTSRPLERAACSAVATCRPSLSSGVPGAVQGLRRASPGRRHCQRAQGAWIVGGGLVSSGTHHAQLVGPTAHSLAPVASPLGPSTAALGRRPPRAQQNSPRGPKFFIPWGSWGQGSHGASPGGLNTDGPPRAQGPSPSP